MSANIEHLRAAGRAATEAALARATAPAADKDDGWETTAAILAAEVDRLRRWKAEALPLFDGLQDLGRTLGLPLGTLITGPAAVEAAEALRAKVARVEALLRAAEEHDASTLSSTDFFGNPWRTPIAQVDLRAALADQSAQDGLSRAGTTSVASGATGDTTGAQRGAQGIEGGKA